jgi:hypothetical protein
VETNGELKISKKNLKNSFKMIDLGFLRYFLGIEVAYSPGGICYLSLNLSLILIPSLTLPMIRVLALSRLQMLK